MLSVIIPVFNEEPEIEDCLRSISLLSSAIKIEVVVADGGSTDRTRKRVAFSPEVKWILSQKGRGNQMNRGAVLASGDILLFLHADCRLPSDTYQLIQRALQDPEVVGGFFQARLDHPDFRFKLSSILLNLRANCTYGATGDQGIFVRKEVFQAMGGYADLPLFEDLHLMRRLKKRGRIAVIASPIRISPRRWLRKGYLKTHLLMWGLRLLYLAGVSPGRLAAFYR